MPDRSPAALAREFQMGEPLFREGEPGEVMYVIRSGSVRLTRTVGGQAIVVGELGDGDFVGEQALLTDEPHATTAVALRTTRCLAIDSALLEAMVSADAEIAIRLLKGMAHRLAQAGPPLHAGAPGPHAHRQSAAPAVRTTEILHQDGDADVTGQYHRALSSRPPRAPSRPPQAAPRPETPGQRVVAALIERAEASGEAGAHGILIRARLAEIGRAAGLQERELAEISKELVRRQLLRVTREGVVVPELRRLYEFVQVADM